MLTFDKNLLYLLIRVMKKNCNTLFEHDNTQQEIIIST